jgi:hypothetical protein
MGGAYEHHREDATRIGDHLFDSGRSFYRRQLCGVWFEGWWKLTELLSPFNVINWAVTVAILAPGIALQIASERVAARI